MGRSSADNHHPYAGMIRIRLKGRRAAALCSRYDRPLSPLPGLPLVIEGSSSAAAESTAADRHSQA